MRWVALILSLFAHQAAAQWAEFEVCGFKLPSEGSHVPEETHKAPGRGPVYVWVPSIAMVIGYTRTKGPRCTKIITPGNQIFVIGNLEQAIAKINRARGH